MHPQPKPHGRPVPNPDSKPQIHNPNRWPTAENFGSTFQQPHALWRLLVEYNVDLAVWNVEKATTKDVGSARSSCPLPNHASLMSWDNLGFGTGRDWRIVSWIWKSIVGVLNLYVCNYTECHVYCIIYIKHIDIYKTMMANYTIWISNSIFWNEIQDLPTPNLSE